MELFSEIVHQVTLSNASQQIMHGF